MQVPEPGSRLRSHGMSRRFCRIGPQCAHQAGLGLSMVVNLLTGSAEAEDILRASPIVTGIFHDLTTTTASPR